MKLIWKETRVSAGTQNLAVSRRLQDQAGDHCLTALDKWFLVSIAMPQEEDILSDKLQRFSPGSELTGKMQNHLSQNFREITNVLGACPRWYTSYAMLTVESRLLPSLSSLLFFIFPFHLFSLSFAEFGTSTSGGSTLGQNLLSGGKYLGTKLIIRAWCSWYKTPETDFLRLWRSWPVKRVEEFPFYWWLVLKRWKISLQGKGLSCHPTSTKGLNVVIAQKITLDKW